MAIPVTLWGIAAAFGADELDCLVRTAGLAVCGHREDLSPRQLELAARAYALIHHEDDIPAAELSPSAEERLLDRAEELDLDPLDLDDHVHDLHSLTASQINNDGLGTQIAYLIGQLGEAEVEAVIRAAAADATEAG